MLLRFKIPKTDDIIEVNFWTWCKSWFNKTLTPYRSTKLNFAYATFEEYWTEYGRREALIELVTENRSVLGMSVDEVVIRASRNCYGRGPVVVLSNINLRQIHRLTERVPSWNNTLYSNDFVFIPADSRKHAKKILAKIPEEFADAIAVCDGMVLGTNYNWDGAGAEI